MNFKCSWIWQKWEMQERSLPSQLPPRPHCQHQPRLQALPALLAKELMKTEAVFYLPEALMC